MEAFDIPALHALCIELSIPGPAAEACLAQAASAQAAPLLRHIPALLDASRAEAAMRELQAKCAPLCPNGLLELAVLLSAALETRKHYAARGVPDDVYLATMGCFSRFLNETHRWTGRWQFDRGFWVWRQLCGRLLRLGTLEFEALPCPLSLPGRWARRRARPRSRCIFPAMRCVCPKRSMPPMRGVRTFLPATALCR